MTNKIAKLEEEWHEFWKGYDFNRLPYEEAHRLVQFLRFEARDWIQGKIQSAREEERKKIKEAVKKSKLSGLNKAVVYAILFS